MSLTPREKTLLLSIWKKIGPFVNAVGGEAFDKLFLGFPQTKNLFTNFDLTPGSADIKAHGGKFMTALGIAAQHLDDLTRKLFTLIDLQQYYLRVAPGNFGLLSYTIQASLADQFPNDFTGDTQEAMDKFLFEVFSILQASTGK